MPLSMDPRGSARRRPSHRRPPPVPFSRVLAVLLVVVLAVLGWRTDWFGLLNSKPSAGSAPGASSPGSNGPRTPTRPTGPQGSPGGTPTTAATTPGPINTVFPGLTTFRGTATPAY